MKKVTNFFISIWKDPVWSKVIAVGILAIFALIWKTCGDKTGSHYGNRKTSSGVQKDSIESKKDKRTILTLLDYSIDNRDKLHDYISILQRLVIPKIRPSDNFIVIPIDGGSKLKPEKLAYFNFGSKSNRLDAITDEFRFQRQMSNFSDSFPKTILMKLSEREAYKNTTDLVGAFEESRQYVEKSNDNILIVFSNMIQETKDFSFSNEFTRAKCDNYLLLINSQHKFPDLKDCKVFVIGATGKSNTQVDIIRYFWESYFIKSQASAMSYGYDNTDILEKHLSN